MKNEKLQQNEKLPDPKPVHQTLSEIMEKMKEQGMDHEFRMSEKGFTTGKGDYYEPGDLKIIKFYRFKGIINSADIQILYIIEGPNKLRGYNLDAYGTYTSDLDEKYDAFIRRIPVEGKGEAEIFGIR